MSELLSAVSILLALIGIVYGVWYPTISETIDMKIPSHLKDAEPHRKKLRHVLNMRARPLAYSAVALTVILLPEAGKILWDSFEAIRGSSAGLGLQYDAVRACLLLVTVLSGLFCVHLLSEVRKLKGLRNRLRIEDG